jgi:hypothetical protein
MGRRAEREPPPGLNPHRIPVVPMSVLPSADAVVSDSRQNGAGPGSPKVPHSAA